MMRVIPCFLGILFLASGAMGQSTTWTDHTSGLMWAQQDYGRNLNWSAARDYCASLSLGGYSGWRLPTIDELAGIYDETQDVNGYHIKGGIQLTHVAEWSSTLVEGTHGDDTEAWVLSFLHNKMSVSPSPRVSFNIDIPYATALCVRR